MGLYGRIDAAAVSGCSNRRLRTNASTAHSTGESTGGGVRSVANGSSPNDANTPCTTSPVVDGAVDSGTAAETVCRATRSTCGGDIVAIACLSARPAATAAMLELETPSSGALTLRPLTRIEAVGCDASLLLVGLFPATTGELILNDDDCFGVVGGTLVSVAVGRSSGCASTDAGAAAVKSAAEVIALDWAPPLPCASPLRGSSVAVDPIEGAPVMLVALVVDEVEDDPPTEVPLDGGASD